MCLCEYANMVSTEYLARCRQRLLLLLSFMLFLAVSACGGGDDPAPVPANTSNPGASTPTISANSIIATVADGKRNLDTFVGQSQTVSLSFKTTDGAAATKLSLQLPATPGWQAAGGVLSCASVTADGSCVLTLSYAPSEPAASATLHLDYSYVDSSGIARTGSLLLNYRALEANAAVVTASPAQTVRAIVGQASVVTLGFGTNDGSSAAALRLAMDLKALPAGWSSDVAAFNCPSFGGGASCQLRLTYAPTQATPPSGLDLAYAYTDSAGKAQTGVFSIAYSALAPNAVAAQVSQKGLIAVDPLQSTDITLSFLPSSGAASALKLADGSPLPAGWSVKSSTLPCAQVNPDGACKLVLSYAPQQSQPQQQLALNFAYTNGAGQAAIGSVSIPYTSQIYRLYVASYAIPVAGDAPSGGVEQCTLAADNGVGTCAAPEPGNTFSGTRRVLVSGANAYVLSDFVDADTPVVRHCSVGADGALSACAGTAADVALPRDIAVLGEFAYIVVNDSPNAQLMRCDIGGDGGLTNCVNVGFDLKDVALADSITSLGSELLLHGPASANLLSCAPLPGASPAIGCKQLPLPDGVQFTGMAAGQAGGASYAYMATNIGAAGAQIYKCSLQTGLCRETQPAGGLPSPGAALPLSISAMKLSGGNLYLLDGTTPGGAVRCRIDAATGDLASCDKEVVRVDVLDAPFPLSIEVR
jgi:hypothetical protein